AQKIRFHLDQGLALVPGQFIGEAAMGKVGPNEDQVPFPEVGNMAPDLPFARSSLYMDQFQFRMVVPSPAAILGVAIEPLIGKGIAKIGGYGLKSRFLVHGSLCFRVKDSGPTRALNLQNYPKYMLYCP